MLPRDPTLLVPEAAALARLPGGHQEGWADALLNLVADFHSAVAAREAGQEYEPSFATFEDGAQLCTLVGAVLDSHRSRQWTRVREAEGVA